MLNKKEISYGKPLAALAGAPSHMAWHGGLQQLLGRLEGTPATISPSMRRYTQ